MHYPFSALVDLDILSKLCEKFTSITGAATAILDLDGKVLVATGWQDICTKFHRVNPGSAAQCTESDTILSSRLSAGEKYNVYKCKNGLVDVAVPIVVGGSHIGNLFTGQFFFEPPDVDYFRKQAAEFGFDEKSYLEALSQVPVFSKEQVRLTMDFLCELAEYIGEAGLNRLNIIEANKELTSEIQHRRRTETALTRQTELINNIFNNIPHSVFWKDRELLFLGCNKVFAEVAGIGDPENIIGKSDYDLPWKDEEADFYRQRDQEVLDKGIPLLDIEETITQADGQKKAIITSKVPLKHEDGSVFGVLGIYYDITEHKRAEEERSLLEARLQRAQKMEALGTLAGGIAHDFNNILGIITGYTELALEKTSHGRENAPEMEQVLNAAIRAKDLVKRILTYSHKTEPELKFLDINREVEQVAGILERTIPKMISVELFLAEDLAPVMGDPGQLEQVILNLSANARDAMPAGGSLIIETANTILDEDYCRLHPGVQPGKYVQVTVSDTGHGMDRETLDQIFHPFFTTKETGVGTGLGLNMVYGIVKAHDGDITCYSKPGQGATFKILLPASEPLAGEKANGITERPASPDENLGTERILLVDDEDALLDLGTIILERAGYQVLTAENGEEALEKYLAAPDRFDLVILDMNMPGMGGRECLKELLAVNPDVKVLVASGYSANGTLSETLDDGAKAFIGKPFRGNELLSAVRFVLDKKA